MFKKLFNIFIFALNIIRVVLKISLTNLNSIEGNSSKNKINLIIYIGDWLVTPLSSFVCFLAIILKQKGFTVTLLYDEFNLHKNFLSKFVNSLISLLLAVLRYKYKISYSRLADNKKKIINYNDYKIDIKKLIEINNVRYNQDIYPPKLKKHIILEKKNYLKNVANTFNNFCNGNTKNSIFIIPGGYLNSSYLITNILKKKKICYYTYDSCFAKNKNFIWYCKNGIAGKMQESLETIKELKAKKILNLNKINLIKKSVDKEIRKRVNKKDIFSYQINSKKNIISGYKNHVIITLNSGWDANSIDSNYIFKDYIDYISQTLIFLNKKFPNLKIVIKDHPMRNSLFRKEDSIIYQVKKMKKKFKFDFISDEINFYDLVKNSKLLISIASTTINEAIILGVPALSVGKDQYYHFKLGINPKNKKEYFKILNKILKNKIKYNKKILEKAYMLYYFNNIIKFTQSELSPQDYNFINVNIKKLSGCKHVNLIVSMLQKKETFIEQLIKK